MLSMSRMRRRFLLLGLLALMGVFAPASGSSAAPVATRYI
jgi:hypothetical protein